MTALSDPAVRERLAQLRALLPQVGGTVLTVSAYDTAWVAALPTPGGAATTPRFPTALAWLRHHQHPDGSWGAPWPYFHDRLLSTLRAVLTLHATGDQQAVARGLRYLRTHSADLARDPWETVGFELIFPALLATAARLGLNLPYPVFAALQHLAAAKLAQTPLILAYDRRTPLVVSLEALGAGFDATQATAVQEADGSVGTSPAATAFLLQHWPTNAPAGDYLAQVLATGSEGGVPAFFPLETFERSWVLYHLVHAHPQAYAVLQATIHPLLEFLWGTATPAGWTASAQSPLKESDTTAVCFAVLSRAGYRPDPALLYQYEEPTHFRCYPFERNPSISANAHILDALHWCEPGARAARVTKIARFLTAQCQPGGFWFDKWHVSPYYTTSHVILAAHDLAPALVGPAVQWLLTTQLPEGSWGYYGATLEETAYALLALTVARHAGWSIPARALDRGGSYLRQQWAPGLIHPPLWIGKTLYAPLQIIDGLILSALLAWEAASGPVRWTSRDPGNRLPAEGESSSAGRWSVEDLNGPEMRYP